MQDAFRWHSFILFVWASLHSSMSEREHAICVKIKTKRISTQGYSKVNVTESFDSNINNENTINHPLKEFINTFGVKKSMVGHIKRIMKDLNFSQCLYCCSVEVRPFLAGVGRTLPMLEEIYQIYLCNYVHFQYIQSDIATHVIQLCLYSLHFRDKSGFHCIRQHLRNYRQKNDIMIMQNSPCLCHYSFEDDCWDSFAELR